MRINIFSKKISVAIPWLVMTFLFFMTACKRNNDGWNDERYKSNYNLYFDNPNPKTGLPYTPAELAGLSYDVKKENRFSIDKPVVLSLVLSKNIQEIKVLDGTNLSVLETITQAQQTGALYRTTLTTTIDKLKITPGTSKILKFDIIYQDGSIGSIQFKVIAVIPLPPLTQSLVGHWKFDDASNLVKATLGNNLVLAGGMAQAAVTGPSGSNGAAQKTQGTFYEMNHALPAVGGAKVNTYTLIYDVKMPALDWSNLLQTRVANDGDGAVFINSSGGLWANGFGSGGSGTIKVNTWHRVVITVGAGAFKVFVDGKLIRSGSAAADGIFALGTDKALIFADNDGEDAAIQIAELMLLKITITNEQASDMPGVGQPII